MTSNRIFFVSFFVFAATFASFSVAIDMYLTEKRINVPEWLIHSGVDL